MLFKGAILSAFSLLATQGAMAAPAPGNSSILIATDAFYACNCPNNCDYTQGSSCKFYSGPSDTDSVTSGTCNYPNGNHLASLSCIP